MYHPIRFILLAAACLGILAPAVRARADDTHPGTPAMMGELGLNIVPDARMDPVGTVRAHISTLDPYVHGALGLQVATPLYINVRQSADTGGSLTGSPSRLSPGIDVKLRVYDESDHIPAIALGLQSAAGDRTMAAEYVALSKRYNSLDFTGGLAWGRMASGSGLPNLLPGHFRKRRDFVSGKASGPADWFTGDHMGLFAGVAWDTPVDGLTLKADWSADAFRAEQAEDPGYKPPKPWSMGFAYSVRKWISLGAALVGGNKIYASLSFQSPLQNWFGRPARAEKNIEPFPAYRTGNADPPSIDRDATAQGLTLNSLAIDDHTISTRYMVEPGPSLPTQIGEILRPIAFHGGADADQYEIEPTVLGLSGPAITLNRRDLEQDLAFDRGSPQEIWRHTHFGPPRPDRAYPPFSTVLQRPNFFGLILDTRASLSEADHGLLYRTGLVGDYKRMLTRHIVSGQSFRLNLADNLKGLNDNRPVDILPVRADEDKFAARRLAVERSYIAYMRSFNDIHIQATAGYLEEMYGGAGGEILYRPFGRTWAIGAEAWEALKRTPYVPFNLGFNGDHLLTGHIKAFYEVPGTDLTLQATAGRYLAEDLGGTLSLTNKFRNGASVEAFVTATNRTDASLYGGTTQLYSGLRIHLPLGNLPYVPGGTEAKFTIAPIGRDSGQVIDNPLPLYDLTDPISYRGIASHWTDLK